MVSLCVWFLLGPVCWMCLLCLVGLSWYVTLVDECLWFRYLILCWVLGIRFVVVVCGMLVCCEFWDWWALIVLWFSFIECFPLYLFGYCWIGTIHVCCFMLLGRFGYLFGVWWAIDFGCGGRWRWLLLLCRFDFEVLVCGIDFGLCGFAELMIACV